MTTRSAYGKDWNIYTYHEAKRLGIDFVVDWRKRRDNRGKYVLLDNWYVVPCTVDSTTSIRTPFAYYGRWWMYAFYYPGEDVIKYDTRTHRVQIPSAIYRLRRSFNHAKHAVMDIVLAKALLDHNLDLDAAINSIWPNVGKATMPGLKSYCEVLAVQELLMNELKHALEASGVNFGDQLKRIDGLATSLDNIVSVAALDPTEYDLAKVSETAKVSAELSASVMALFERLYYENSTSMVGGIELPSPKSAPPQLSEANYEEVKDAV